MNDPTHNTTRHTRRFYDSAHGQLRGTFPPILPEVTALAAGDIKYASRQLRRAATRALAFNEITQRLPILPRRVRRLVSRKAKTQ